MRGLTSLLASVMLLAGATVSAQEPDKPTPTDAVSTRDWARAQGNRIGLETDYFSSSWRQGVWDPVEPSQQGMSSRSSQALSVTPVLQLEVRPKLYVDAEIPFGFNLSSSEGVFALGNPTIGFHYAPEVNDEIVLFAGVTFSVPTMGDSAESSTKRIAIQLAHSRAFYDAHRMMPRAFGFRARTGVEIRILPWLYYRGDLAPVLYIPISGNELAYITPAEPLRMPTSSGDLAFLLEQGNELEARVPMGFGGGLRLQEVFTLTEDDHVQTALGAFLSYEPRMPDMYARLGLLLALDEELGLGFDEGRFKVATVRIDAGYKF